ncbi:hypothetical protein QN239_02815 [Mycolicibacterium sp. Y3]
MANRSLCDTEITPDERIVVVGDAGAHTMPGIYVYQGITPEVDSPAHLPWIRTISDHECVVGRCVRVRVFAGSDTDGLGALAGPSDITVLIPDEPSFSHAVPLAPTPPWWSPQRSWSREA